MNKFSSKLTVFLYFLFFASTGILLFIFYKDFTSTFTYYFIIGYSIFIICFIFYLLWIATIKWKNKFSWSLLRKKILQFVCLFILFSLTSYLFNYFFLPSHKDFTFSFTALGFAFGLSFLDVPTLSQTKKD